MARILDLLAPRALLAGLRWWMLPLLVLLILVTVAVVVLSGMSSLAPAQYAAF